MRLGLTLGYAPPGTNPAELVELAVEAEGLGYDSAWTAEAWGTDAVTVLAFLAARTSTLRLGAGIMQIPARTPAMTAMTAVTLDLISGGRFLLGLGTSGPAVAEGWHGQEFGRPLARTREYVEIVRAALRREPLDHHGEYYDVPRGGHRPLKLMARPVRAEIPVYLAAVGPKNVALAAEIADGWLPIWLSPERLQEVFGESLAGAREGFDVAAFSVPAVVTDDVEAGRDAVRPVLALYVGGMGTYYNRLVGRYGYEAEAAAIRELYLGGKQRDAAAAVPDALIDELCLVGPRERIADRLGAWRESGVTTLLVQTRERETLRTMAELLL
jgi:F420-dependent oxidoreductase-like protein